MQIEVVSWKNKPLILKYFDSLLAIELPIQKLTSFSLSTWQHVVFCFRFRQFLRAEDLCFWVAITVYFFFVRHNEYNSVQLVTVVWVTVPLFLLLIINELEF